MKALIEEGVDAELRDGPSAVDGLDGRGSEEADTGATDLPSGGRMDEAASAAVTYRSYWPGRFSVEKLLHERSLDARAFAKQYQNEVAPEEGLVFERIWFEDRFDTPPGEIIFKVDSWDTAAGQGRQRSYSVGLSAAVSADFHIYILNMLRGQLPYPDLKESIRMTARRNKSSAVIIEAKSSGHQAVQELHLEGFPIVAFQPFGQKGSPSREEGNIRISDICAQRRVHLPSDYYCRRSGSRGWLPDFEREVFSYPDGEQDDIVDALCQMLWWVEEQRLRNERFLKAPKKPTPWAESWAGEGQRVRV
jgi:predicted phage terminase large subunit-like protein